MANRNFTLPLSRWHHVADRIRQFADSKTAEAFAVLAQMTVQTPINATQQAALAARGEKALLTLTSAREALVTVGVVRQALATANANAGVTAMLAETESKRREAQFLRKFASVDLVTKVTLGEANEALAAASNKAPQGFGYDRNPGVSVTPVNPAALEGFAAEAAELEATVASLTDQVADLNRTTLSLQLPEELAKAVGLV